MAVARKTVPKKRPAVRKPTARNKKNNLTSKITKMVFAIVLLLFFTGVLLHYRSGIAYYLGFRTDKIAATSNTEETKRFSDVRNYELLSRYEDRVAGIDVSEYQGTIQWDQVRFVENTFPLAYVFIRATAGVDKVDNQFENNWREAKKNTIIRGAYHYYRPNENSIAQAENFIKTVRLQKGDLPPVLDIESTATNQPIDSLKAGIRRWLEIVDAHYKVRPIIYTGENFYNAFLKDDFSGYTFWIANYNFFVEDMKDDWLFWQFTEKSSIQGIQGNVDVNIYNGTPKMLNYMRVNK